MDPRSEALLAHVHPDLAKVMRSAAQLPQPFLIVYGVRSLAAEMEAVRTGNSKTLHSRHLPDAHFRTHDDPNGVAMAVDVAALENGKVSFAKGREEAVFGAIAAQVMQAAGRLKIPLQWGGAKVGAWVPGQVSHFRDWGHFQLPWKEYP